MAISLFNGKPGIGRSSKSYCKLEYTNSASSSQTRWIGFPLGKFPTKLGLRGGWWDTGITKKQTRATIFSNKKQNEIFLSQIQKMRLLSSQSSFYWILLKTLPSQISIRGKTRNGKLLAEFDSWRYAENLLKMKTFLIINYKAYPH